jgi:hypothetical protein
MTTEQEKLGRERMVAQPFTPVANLGNDSRDSRSLEYIAFYLGEITNHLAGIAAQLNNNSVNGTKIALELQGLAQVLQMKP